MANYFQFQNNQVKMETRIKHSIRFADWIKRQPLLMVHITSQETRWMSSEIGVIKSYTSEELYNKFINYESL